MLLTRVLSEGSGGPNTGLLWILGILLGFFALTILAGWLVGSSKPHEAQAESEPHPVKPVAVEERVKTPKASRPFRGRGRKK